MLVHKTKHYEVVRVPVNEYHTDEHGVKHPINYHICNPNAHTVEGKCSQLPVAISTAKYLSDMLDQLNENSVTTLEDIIGNDSIN